MKQFNQNFLANFPSFKVGSASRHSSNLQPHVFSKFTQWFKLHKGCYRKLASAHHDHQMKQTGNWNFENNNLSNYWCPHLKALLPLIWNVQASPYISVFSEEACTSWSNFYSTTPLLSTAKWNRTKWMNGDKWASIEHTLNISLSFRPLVVLLSKRPEWAFSAVTAEAVNLNLKLSIRQRASSYMFSVLKCNQKTNTLKNVM